MSSVTDSKPGFSNNVFAFIYKHGLQYYASILNFLVIWGIHVYTNEPRYIFAYYYTLLYSGKLFPKDAYPGADPVEEIKSKKHLIPLLLYTLIIWIMVIGVFVTFPLQHYNTTQTIVFTVLAMAVLSVTIGVAHDYLHCPYGVLKLVGKLQLAIIQFTVYPYMHIFLHHKHVGTEIDIITCPKNKSCFRYAAQVHYYSNKFVYDNNKVQFFTCWLINLGYIFGLLWLGWFLGNDLYTNLLRVGYMLLVGIGGFYLFEFLESTMHYGLVYRKHADEKGVGEACAWNQEENLLVSFLVFRAQRHSDHHMNAYKPYSSLELTQAMPTYPFDILQASMIVTSPQLWYKVANPYVDEVMENKPVSKEHKEWVKSLRIRYMVVILGLVWTLAITA